jgi:murein DD-endopeptidase MepM/ murein hydrolase activator NlpD
MTYTAKPSKGFERSGRAVALAILLAVAQWSPAIAAPPGGQTYFTILLGLSEDYSWEADCLRFGAGTVCTSGSLCGTWQSKGGENFELEFQYEEDGETVDIQARGQVESTGKKDSIGGVGTLSVGRTAFNFGFTGRPMKKNKCAKLLRAWTAANPPAQADQFAPCVQRADFPSPAQSEYVLPFPKRKTYHLSQTYCYLHSTHRNELAYDFDLPLGAEIVAARAGEVVDARDDLPNDSPWPNANYMKVRHEDGTVASYIHLMQNSIRFGVGSRVEQGQVIAQASMSGTIDPHLHFVVFRSQDSIEGDDVAVSFRNSEGPLDPRGGLIQGQDYKALPY